MEIVELGKLLNVITGPVIKCNCRPRLVLKLINSTTLEMSGHCKHVREFLLNTNVITGIEWACNMCGALIVEDAHGRPVYDIVCEHYIAHGHFTKDVETYKKLSSRIKNRKYHHYNKVKSDYVCNLQVTCPT